MLNVVKLIPCQPDLRLLLPTVQGNVDYQEFRLQLEQIDQVLVSSGLEEGFVQECVTAWAAGVDGRELDPKQQAKVQLRAHKALRCNLARALVGENCRGFSRRLADSPLLQWFCGLDRLDVVRVPSKSEVQRYATLLPEDQLRPLMDRLLAAAAQTPAQIGLDAALDLDAFFLDTTCVKTNIHYPVDWLLLHDGTRTLLKAIRLIRQHGLKNRMEPPEQFLKRMKPLCMTMTHTRRKADGKKQRKQVLRLM